METQLQNHIAFCIDESGSVKRIIKPLVEAYNQTVTDIRGSVLDEGQLATMTAMAFGDINLKHRILYVGQQVQTVQALDYTSLNPTGMTPLFDSVYRAIKKLEELDDGKPETTFIVSTITDGQENASKKPGVPSAIKLIKEKMQTERWTFTFLVPNGYEDGFSRKYSIPRGNVQGWDTKTDRGTREAFVTTSAAFKGYFRAKSAGVTSSKSFYADVSDLTVREARTALSEITKQVKFIIPVETCKIKAAIEDDQEALLAYGKKGLLQLIMASHAGMTETEFNTLDY